MCSGQARVFLGYGAWKVCHRKSEGGEARHDGGWLIFMSPRQEQPEEGEPAFYLPSVHETRDHLLRVGAPSCSTGNKKSRLVRRLAPAIPTTKDAQPEAARA